MASKYQGPPIKFLINLHYIKICSNIKSSVRAKFQF